MAHIKVKVRNKKGTGSKTPPSGYSSWLEYWEDKKGQKATECKAHGCDGSADVGGHVIKSGQGGKEYILPICNGHNALPEDKEYTAWEDDLVPVHP